MVNENIDFTIGGQSVQQYVKTKELIPTPETETSGLQRFCLRAHNEKRALHNASPLGYNEELAAIAQEWAEDLIRQKKFEHRPNNPYGENLYINYNLGEEELLRNDEELISRSIYLWYAEAHDFKNLFGKEPKLNKLLKGPETGHFTQLVWRESTAVGVGIARGNNAVVVCCNYAPTGNIIGEFAVNVKPLTKTIIAKQQTAGPAH